MNEEIRLILDQTTKNRAILGDINLYVFGSATRPSRIPNDIDILVIYHHSDQPKLLRKLLDKLLYIKIDLTFMTQEEEAETDFVRLQKCLPIYQQLFS